MSKQFQFSRPVEYDPSLATNVKSNTTAVSWSKQDELKDEFGFESDDDDFGGGGEDGLPASTTSTSTLNTSIDSSPPAFKKATSMIAAHSEELEQQHAEELDSLATQLAESQDARLRAEEAVKRTEERLEELQNMSKQAKNILVAKFRQQLKVLMAQVEEQKSMLAEDDETIENLRSVNAKLEGGDKAGAAEIQQRMKEFKDARVQARENTTLRYKVEELNQQLKSTKEELAEAKAAADAASEKIRSADGESLESLRTRCEKLEAERLVFRDEIKKRHLERTKLVSRLAKLTGSNDPLAEIDNDVAMPATAAASTTANGTGPGSAAQAAEIASLQSKVRSLEALLAKATSASASVAPTVNPVAAVSSGATGSAREAELNEMLKKMDDLLKRRESELNEVKEKAKEKLTTASNAIKKLKTEYATLRTAYDKAKEQVGAAAAAPTQTPAAKVLAANLPRRKELLLQIKKTLALTKASLGSIKTDVSGMHKDIPSLGPSISGAVASFIAGRAGETQHLRDALKKEMSERKKLFNQIQELKGNIRVYARVRPINQRELADKDNGQAVTFPQPNEMAIFNVEKKTSHTFEFEKVFEPHTTQTEVFTEVADLVTSVLDGYNVCIFAYGQTGSGKSHTMQGPPSDPGVNIRALTRLFEVAGERFPDVKYDIKVTLLEIYNEKIQDLLGEKGRVLKAVQGQYGMEVQDLTMVSVANEKEVLKTLEKGSKNRSVSATNMNDVSSRSHLILSVYVMAHNAITGKSTMGKMHLIDLAGSERVGRSGVTGDAMKEAQAINASLSALGNVIAARANKSAHVPYRDSTLTYLLQDSLEKNSKTLMFVNLSPVLKDSSETICSLRFAERVRKVELGTASATKAPKAK